MSLVPAHLALPWGSLAYDRRPGTGPAVVFLHGTGCDNADWQDVLERLPEGLDLVALEFRGHGASAVPAVPFTLADLAADVLRLLTHLDLAETWLVGHSLGGMVALEAMRQGARVSGLVLLEGWTKLAVVREAFGPEHHFGGLSQAAREAVLAKFAATRARFAEADWAHFWRSVEASDAGDCLATAKLPIIEVYGAADALPEAAERLGVPARDNIRWEWVPGAGHYLPPEAPAAVARIIAAAVQASCS
jgi:pimeloyl-ACP methyl ester carboxylesterase